MPCWEICPQWMNMPKRAVSNQFIAAPGPSSFVTRNDRIGTAANEAVNEVAIGGRWRSLQEMDADFPQSLVRQAHQNLELQFRLVANSGRGGGVKESEGVVFLASGLPYAMFNRMFAIDPPAAPPAALGRAREFFEGLGLPWSVCAAPEAVDALKGCVAVVGLTRLPPLPLMLLQGQLNRNPIPEGFTVRRCVSDADAGMFVRVASRGFSSPKIIFDAFCRPGVYDSAHVTHFVGLMGDEPVACATLITTATIAGIYNVATLARFRGRGFGAAITAHAANIGFATGCTASALQASAMGFGVYERMGYRRVCDFTIWAPD